MPIADLVSCITGSGCPNLKDLPPAGGILGVIALLAVVLSQSRVKNALTGLVNMSPEGLVALVTGGAVYLYSGRTIPFTIALATAGICYLLVWGPVGQRTVAWIATFPQGHVIKSIPAPRLVLYAGGLLFALAQLGSWATDRMVAHLHERGESEVLVAIVLPAPIDESLGYNQHKTLLDSSKRGLYQEVHTLLHSSLDHLHPKLELLPAALPDNPKDTDETIARLEALRRKPSDLASYRKGLGSPVDLVIEPFFEPIDVSGSIRTTNYGMQIRQLDRAEGAFETWPLAKKIEWVHAPGVWDDHRLAALLSIAKAAVISSDEKLHQDHLLTTECEKTWKRLIDAFQDYYHRNLAKLKRRVPPDWYGHDLEKNKNCAGKECVRKWIAAHDQPSHEREEAKAAMKREATRQSALLLQSARDGGTGR